MNKTDIQQTEGKKDKRKKNPRTNNTPKRNIKVRTVLVFVLTFLVLNAIVHLQLLNTENQEKLKATYTAESTIRRIESQIDKYLSKTDMLKSMIESGYEIGDSNFDSLGGFLVDGDNVIVAVEMAEDGVVNMVYPLNGNEAALGLDMLGNPKRRREAAVARDSGSYTIAGPFELTQGGYGALLFDPVYVKDSSGDSKFWGFSLLVLDWDRFIEETEIAKLEDTGYHYQVWRNQDDSGERIMIASCQDGNLKDSIEVNCDVPNDVWYFDIVPVDGWISGGQLIFGSVLCLAVALLIALVFWQYATRRHKEQVYTAEIEKAAEDARLANEAKTRFLFNMSHDIRTPMNAIIGFTKLLREHSGDQKKVNDYKDKINA